MTIGPHKCGHGKRWDEDCPECDLVWEYTTIKNFGSMVDAARKRIAEIEGRKDLSKDPPKRPLAERLLSRADALINLDEIAESIRVPGELFGIDAMLHTEAACYIEGLKAKIHEATNLLSQAHCYVTSSAQDEEGELNGAITDFLLGREKVTGKQDVCPNCDSELPKGCGGLFKKDGDSCWWTRQHTVEKGTK